MMKRLLILILIVCAVLLAACTPGNSQNGSPEGSSARNDTEETLPETESATDVPEPRATDSGADEPKVTLPKDQF